MSAALVWSNVLAYTLQVGLLVGLGALVRAALRIRIPRFRLLYWQILLAACLALPWIRPRPWRQHVVAGAQQVSDIVGTLALASAPVSRTMPWPQIALWLLAAGVAIRLAWLCVGLVRLSGYRRRGETFPAPPGMCGAVLLLSDAVASPVMFGWRDPAILLPAGFAKLPEEMREAILCHELLHVERRDWLFTIAEELVRAVLWFHPAIWWVLGEIQLSREQTVDQAVIKTTQARGPYVDALLLMAGAAVDLAPAPMFLRKRHLKKRLLEVMKEVGMAQVSKTRLAGVMGVAFIALAASCWLATGIFPLTAAPQSVGDSAGVAVNANGSRLMHRSGVPYPPEALARGIEGSVVVQVKLDANGEVSDAAVLSGPDELRKAVLQSVLTWHFDKSAALTTRTVSVDFVKPATVSNAAATAPPPPPPAPGPRAASGYPAPISGKLDRIVISGLSDSARSDLLSRLPVQEGDELSGDTYAAVTKEVKAFDPHLTLGLARTSANDGRFELRIGLANSGPAIAAQPGAVTFTANTVGAAGSGSGVGMGVGSGGAIAPAGGPSAGDVYSVGNGTSPPALLKKLDPQLPDGVPAGFAGSVLLSIVVGTDGKAESIQVVKSLGPNFDVSAADAVLQWTFRPGVNNGVPVKVRAQIEVNFRKL